MELRVNVLKVILLAVCTALPALAYGMNYEVTRHPVRSGGEVNVVHMSGMIAPGEWQEFMGATGEIDPKLDTVFVLDSPGGNVPMGLFLIRKVDEFLQVQATNQRQVWVVVEKDCSSMCVPLYTAFAKRFAVRDSRIGLHSVSVGGLATDSDMTKIYLQSIRDHAISRNESGLLSWLQAVVEHGDFSTSALTPYKVQELSALTPSENILANEEDFFSTL